MATLPQSTQMIEVDQLIWEKKMQFKIAFSNPSADYHNHFMADNTL